MDTLFIDRQQTRLDTEAGRLIVRAPEARPITLPLRQIRQLVVSARTELSTTVLLALHREGIGLVVLNPREPENHLVCGGGQHGNVARRLSQYAWYSDEGRRLEAARALVGMKLLHQQRALARHRRRRPDLRRPLTRAMEQVRERRESLKHTTSLGSLRGVEGAAAASYFSAFALLVAPRLGFTGRKRRPPPDPVNAVLSLTYTLLHGESMQALVGRGLDPCLGALHDIDYGRASLACDMQELLRTDAETWVLEQFRVGNLEPSHFQPQANGAHLLNKEGRAIYYPLYQQRAIQLWRPRCGAIADNWAARVTQAALQYGEVQCGEVAGG